MRTQIDSSTWEIKYTVYNSPSKGWVCDCPHFAIRGTPCYHIRDIKKEQEKLKTRARSISDLINLGLL
jgi:hypothetical protein